ncbi:MAG: CHAT domain-containing protein [Bacteroidales bacterium]|nr:CHAT domain-containing protein [Bacteroidales bacterium]
MFSFQRILCTFLCFFIANFTFSQKIDIKTYRSPFSNSLLESEIDRLERSENNSALMTVADSLSLLIGESQKSKEHLFYLNNISDYLSEHREIDSAQAILLKAVDRAKLSMDTLCMEYAYTHYLLGYTYYLQRDFIKRLEYEHKTTAVFEHLDHNEKLLSHGYSSIMVGYLSTKQLDKGYEYFIKANQHCQNQGDHYYQFENFVAMANAINFYEPELALDYLNYAADYFDYYLADSVPQTAYFHIIWGSAHTALDRHEKAKEIYIKGLEVFYKNKEKNAFFESIFYYYLGVSDKFLANYPQALAYHDTAIHIINEKLGGRESMYASELRQKGEIFNLMKNYDSALVYFDRAYEIELKTRGNDPYFTTHNLVQKARTFLCDKQIDSALNLAQKAIYTYGNVPLDQNIYSLPEVDSLDLQSVLGMTAALGFKARALELKQSQGASPESTQAIINCYAAAMKVYDVAAFQNVLSNSGLTISSGNRELADQLIEFTFNHIDQLTDHSIQEIWSILARTKSYQLTMQKYKMQPGERALTLASENNLQNRQKNIFKLSDAMAAMNPDFTNSDYRNLQQEYLSECLSLFMQTFQLSDKTALTKELFLPKQQLEEVFEILDQGHLLVDYYQKENKMLSFSLMGDKVDANRIELPDNYNQLMNSLLKSVKTAEEIDVQQRKALSKLLLTNCREKLTHATHLVISPDQTLWNFPFELLCSQENETAFLIEQLPISYAYSTALLKQDAQKKNSENQLLLMAPGFINNDKKFNQQLCFRDVMDSDSNRIWNNEMLKPLPFSLKEAHALEAMAEKYKMNCNSFYNSQATKENFLLNYASSDIIHLSTHGLASKVNPEQSGLFFWPASDHKSDYYLSLNELFQTHCQANLVVLSACQTGYGTVVDGEGVMALPRGFLYAGIPNVICSLWKIHDRKTMELMNEFYSHVFQGESYARALQLAKIKMIKNGDLPMDWSVVIQIGVN